MSKVNFDAALTGLDGKPMRQTDAEDSPPAALKHVALMALGVLAEHDDAAKKMRCFELMLKANAGGEQVVTAEDVVLLKEKIGAICPPLVVGTTYRLLEG